MSYDTHDAEIRPFPCNTLPIGGAVLRNEDGSVDWTVSRTPKCR